jgi:hypothetical protein
LSTASGETLPYLWGINADGSNLTQLSAQPALHFAVNPNPQADGNSLVAYIGASTDDLRQDLALYLRSLPDGVVTTLTPLTSVETSFHPDEKDSTGVNIEEKENIAAGLWDTQSLAWSPNGEWLAFVGAMDGPSLDLYSYQRSTGVIRRLTDGPSHAYQILWTEDSAQIMHSAKGCFLCAGGPYEVADGIWGAAPDGSALVTYEGPASARFVAWRDSTHLLMDSGPRNGGLGNVRILDIANNQIEPIDLDDFDSVAYDDSGRYAMLYSYGDTDLLNEGRGLYLVDIDAREAIYFRDDYAYLWWDRYEQRFLISGDMGFSSFSTDGALTLEALSTSQAPSPNGRFSAWFDVAPRENWDGGLWLQTGDSDLEKVMDGSGISLGWSPDSRSFFYDLGHQGLYLILAESMEVIELFTEPGLPDEWLFSSLDWQATWVSQ